MAASAVNIGAGDGSAGAGQATVTASVDTGAASLPVTLEVCESGPTGCVTPRGQTATTGVFDPNVAKTYTVFVRANGSDTVPFSPANSRVFLRFRDAGGVLRSATSAAISAPAPADQPIEVAEIEGRWSVLIRQQAGVWPVLRRASVYLTSDGTAIIDDGIAPRAVAMEVDALLDASVHLRINGLFGTALADGQILVSDAFEPIPGAFWGVRDARSETTASWSDLAGSFGDSLAVSDSGEIRGIVNGCAVYGQATGLATQAVTLSLTGCANSGTYLGIAALSANDNETTTLLIANERRGWRVER